MRVYFLAEKLCGLTVNGLFLGTVDGFERSAEIDPQDGVFCELSPVGYLPVRFRLDEEFLLSPPQQIRLYYTEKGVAIYACDFLRADQSTQILDSVQLGGSVLTLFTQGKLRLKLENETGTHLLDLPDALENCRPALCGEEFLLEGEATFALLSRDGKLLVCSEGRVTERQRRLAAEVPFHDSMGHSAVCVWERGKLTQCTVRSAREPTETTFALALFESVLIGADAAPFLHECLLAKAGALRSFLGDFRSVVLTDETDCVGLVYERTERVYDVRYFRITVTDGKISNLSEQ